MTYRLDVFLMNDYQGGRLLASSEGVDFNNMLKFDIPKLCEYIRDQKRKGRKSEDITLDEVRHLIIKG